MSDLTACYIVTFVRVVTHAVHALSIFSVQSTEILLRWMVAVAGVHTSFKAITTSVVTCIKVRSKVSNIIRIEDDLHYLTSHSTEQRIWISLRKATILRCVRGQQRHQDWVQGHRTGHSINRCTGISIPKIQIRGCLVMTGIQPFERDKLSIRSPEATSMARATAFNKMTVLKFFRNLYQVMKKNNFRLTASSTWMRLDAEQYRNRSRRWLAKAGHTLGA